MLISSSSTQYNDLASCRGYYRIPSNLRLLEITDKVKHYFSFFSNFFSASVSWGYHVL